jgi:hypothetical protein
MIKNNRLSYVPLNPVAFFIHIFLATACVRGPSFLNAGGSSGIYKRTNGSALPSSTISKGGTSGTSSSGVQRTVTEDGTVRLETSSSSAVSGTKVSFPPGSIAVDTTVDVTESVPVATAATAAELGIENISTASKAVVVSSDQKVDPAQPFSVSLELPSSNLQGSSSNLVVIYRVYSHSSSQSLAGVIPPSGYVLSGGNVRFFSRYFGSFQAAYTSSQVSAPVEVPTSTSVMSKSEAEVLPKVSVTARRPLVVMAGETVSLSGSNFRLTMVVAMGGKKVGGLKVASDSAASFTSPADVSMGLVNLTIEQDGISQVASIIYGGDKNDLPVITMSSDAICAGINYYDKNGNRQTGTKACSQPPACSADGQTGCMTTSSFPSVDAASVPVRTLSGSILGGVKGNVLLPPPAKVLSGENFGPSGSLSGSLTLPPATAVVGISGPYGVGGNSVTPSISTCSTSVTQGCLALAPYNAGVTCSINSQKNCHIPLTGTFSSADLSNLTAANIKRGVSVAGVIGNFPSSSSPLPRYIDSGSGTATAGSDEPDLTNFNTQLTSDGVFEFWDSTGTRRTGSGDSDLSAANLKSGVSLENFGLAGSVIPFTQCQATSQSACVSDSACRWTGSICELNPVNIRAGVTIVSKAGTLKTNCRSTVNSTYFNYDGPVSSLITTGDVSGTQSDTWDTITDYYSVSPTRVNSWSNNTFCDSSDWTDVTTTNGGTSYTTCGASSTCIYKDSISGLTFSGVLSAGGNTTAGSSAYYTWPAANEACYNSTYGGYPAGTWRLPTQKELMTAYVHGFKSLGSAAYTINVNVGLQFWSATTIASPTTQAVAMTLNQGLSLNLAKTTTAVVMCVF